MPSTLLIAFPGPLVKSLVWERRDVVVFDESGWWIIDGSSTRRRLVDVTTFKPRWTPDVDIHGVIGQIKEWGPMWARWIAHADQWELLYREAANYVLQVAEALSDLHVTTALFHTGIAHHLDTSLLQIACARRGIPQVFLYSNLITARLQPLVQVASIEDRSRLGAVVSDHDAGDDIRAFHANSVAGLRPAANVRDAPLRGAYQSPLFGVLDAAYMAARQRATLMVHRFTRVRTNSTRLFERFKPLGLIEFVRLIANQAKGLTYHDAHLFQGDPLSPTYRPKGFTLLLAAHQQPEATSFPEGGSWHNHFDIVVKLRTLGYDAPVIYKEHIGSYLYYSPIIHQTRVGVHRSESYFRMLEELGCVFMDPRMSFTLASEANQWVIPVTITGTIAIERSLAGLKTIVTGYPWYRGLPGTLDLSSMTSFNGLADLPKSASPTLSRDAFDFLDAMLSGTTLINAPGIGTGEPLSDQASAATFTQEFNRLLEQLPAIVPARARLSASKLIPTGGAR